MVETMFNNGYTITTSDMRDDGITIIETERLQEERLQEEDHDCEGLISAVVEIVN